MNISLLKIYFKDLMRVKCKIFIYFVCVSKLPQMMVCCDRNLSEVYAVYVSTQWRLKYLRFINVTQSNDGMDYSLSYRWSQYQDVK
jgi:hypothetical protein